MVDRASETHRGSGRQGLPSIYDPATNFFQDWYFDLRLEEELVRCQRYGYQVSLVLVRASAGDRGPGLETSDALATFVASDLRGPDIAAVLNQNELAICLPYTDASGAAAVAERVSAVLGGHAFSLGIATAPGDARSAGGLYITAAERAQAVPANRSS